MDRELLLQRLKQSQILNKNLLSLLKSLQFQLNQFEIQGNIFSIFSQQLLYSLIPLTCEDSIRATYQSEQIQKQSKDKKDSIKKTIDSIMDRVTVIILSLTNQSQLAAQNTIQHYLQHLDKHPTCTNSYLTLLKLLLHSDQIRSILKQNDTASIIVTHLQQTCCQPQPPPSPPKPQMPTHNRNASDLIYTNLNMSSSINYPPQYRTAMKKTLISGDQSFMIEFPTLHGHTVKSRALRRAALQKTEEPKPKFNIVPMLNLPEGMSSRRNQVQRSVSYRSGRVSAFSGSWGDNAPSPLTSSPFGKDSKVNTSNIQDFQTSILAEQSTNYKQVFSPGKLMCNLAMQLGQACLTADLTALIAQKRDNDLQKIAKMAAMPGRNINQEPGKEKKPKLQQAARSNSLSSLRFPQKAKHRLLLFDEQADSMHSHKLRTAILSLLYYLYLLYQPNELQYLRSPVNILFGHILSVDFSRLQSIVSLKNQESGEYSDDQQEMYEQELVCAGQEQEKIPDFVNLKHLREEMGNIPTHTVPGVSPRGAKPMQDQISPNKSISLHNDSSWFLANDPSQLQLGFFKLWSHKQDILIPEYIAVFSILRLFGQYTESIHRQAVMAGAPDTQPNSSSSQMYEAISPKRTKIRSPVISMGYSILMEDPFTQKDLSIWIHGVKYTEGANKERLRKRSDILLFRFHKQLVQTQEDLHGYQLYEREGDLYQLLARYMRVCRSRITFFQAVDLVFEQVLNTKKSIIDSIDNPDTRNLPAVRHQISSFLQVISQFFIQAPTVQAFKLVCDIFIANDIWQDTVRTLTLAVLQEFAKVQTRSVIKYFNSIAILLRKIVNQLQLDRRGSELNQEEKNWRDIVRRVLKNFTWLIGPDSGIIPRYLQKFTPQILNGNLNNYSPPPRNLFITKAVLELLINLYWFSPRFSCYRSADYALHYIRMHYISFLKLYTINKPKQSQPKPSLNATVGKSDISSSTVQQPQNSAYLHSCLVLCKLHLKCLFAYARNRTVEVTRKFYQFRLLEFLTREIDLEYDITLRRERFIQMHKAEKQRVTMKFTKKDLKADLKPPSPEGQKTSMSFKLNLSGMTKGEQNMAPQFSVPKLNLGLDSAEPPIQKPVIPALKLGIGKPTEEEKKPVIPVLKIGQTEQIEELPKKPIIPSLKIGPIEASGQLSAKKPPIPQLKIGFLTQDPQKKQIQKQEFVKAIVQEQEKKMDYQLTRIQNSLDGTNKFQLALDMNASMEKDDFLASQQICKQNDFYWQQRRQREIYSDQELQTLMIGLIFCLLLTPTRGSLQQLYCSQYPINNGKPNVLFLLHHHLNHSANNQILPRLMKLTGHIVPPLAGQRLLKLLSGVFFDSSRYQNWHKVAEGAYGTVYQCSTGLSEPETVAIKKMSVPKSIYDRCVLHDIFTEIACLEEFRMERCVTDLYDYGLDDNDYYIVMKMYKTSLKQWRLGLPGQMEDHLPMLLTIFRQICKSVQIIHSHNTTHYDLKCDNVLLQEPIQDCQVTIGDFGECRMFVNSDDENCLRNKGTQYIKSPQMLVLTITAKKEHDQYDRRKKIGTTRASDIWSLGCLFYQLLTGEFLFYHQDWVHFYIRCTSPNQELLTEEKIQKINRNVYLVDFLRYMIVRDPRHRPSIDNVLKRFQHLHALLVSASTVARRVPLAYEVTSFSEFQEIVEQSVSLMSCTSQMKEIAETPQPAFLRITHDIYLCSSNFFREKSSWLMNLGVTHVVYSDADECTLKKFQNIMVGPAPLQSLAGIMDFLRAANVHKGSVLFVQNQDLQIRECLLVCLSDIFSTNFYQTWTLVNSQLLFFNLPAETVRVFSVWTLLQSKIKQYLSRYPRYTCLCGSCTIILKRHRADPKYQNFKSCNCSRQYRNVDTSDCPSPGCGDFLHTLKDLHGLNWDSLKWGFAEKEDFLIGHMCHNKLQEQVILNSMNLDSNVQLFKIIEKKPWRSGSDQWSLYSCKVCYMWVYAVSSDDSKIAYLANINMTGVQPGIMAGQGDLRVPVLSKIKLPLLVEQRGSEMVKPSINYARRFVPAAKPTSQILT